MCSVDNEHRLAKGTQGTGVAPQTPRMALPHSSSEVDTRQTRSQAWTANLDQPPILHADSRETHGTDLPTHVNKWHPAATTAPALHSAPYCSHRCPHTADTFNMLLHRRPHLSTVAPCFPSGPHYWVLVLLKACSLLRSRHLHFTPSVSPFTSPHRTGGDPLSTPQVLVVIDIIRDTRRLVFPGYPRHRSETLVCGWQTQGTVSSLRSHTFPKQLVQGSALR